MPTKKSKSDVASALEEFFQGAKKPVLFAGAGTSTRAGIPSWGGYIKDLAIAVGDIDPFTKYQMDKASSKDAYDLAASYFFLCDEMTDSKRWSELTKPLKHPEHLKLKDLCALPFSAIVTTNYDRALIDAYAAANGKAAQEVNIDEPTLSSAIFLDEPYIARIHGRIEHPPSMRLSKEHLELILENQPYVQFLTHLFSRCQVLFLGFSFSDPAISTVLRAIKSAYGSMHGTEHMALLPDKATDAFVSELQRLDVRKVVYDSTEYHRELWSAIEALANAPRRDTRESLKARRREPFAVAKKYLATAYARMRLGGYAGPLSSLVVEGIIGGILAKDTESGQSEAEIAKRLSQELALPADISESLVARGLSALVVSGSCRFDTGSGRYSANDSDAGKSLEGAVLRLVRGTIDRYLVRENGSKDRADLHHFLEAFFSWLVLKRGWDLGAAFAAHRMPDEIDVLEEMKSFSSDIKIRDREMVGLASAIEDMLTKPDDEEAELLAQLGSVSFALELMIESPRDALFYRRTLPEKVYLDANVLMPAIVDGHPHHNVVVTTIGQIRDGARAGAGGVAFCVYDGFLNEIVSHRELAISQMRVPGSEAALWAEREAGMFGPGNVNVFVGAYFNLRDKSSGKTFDQFIRESAPYRSESELRRFLESKGYVIVNGYGAEKKDLPGILHSLEVHYASALEYARKSAIVISHDATQLSILSADIRAGRRALLVSADRRLRTALVAGGFGWLESAMTTHVGLAQFAQLIIGKNGASRGISSLIWASRIPTNTEKVRNHLIGLALREHDVAMAMGMREVVDAIAEDAGMELDALEVDMDHGFAGAGRDTRIDAHGVLDRYEREFFRRMNEEMKKVNEVKNRTI